MTVLNVLKWATGSKRPLDHNATIDEAALVAAILGHGLAGRVLRRLAELAPPPAWATRTLVRTLESDRDETARRMARQILALSELRAASDAEENAGSFIVVKGFTLYAISGDPASRRAGGDLDLLALNPLRLRERLLHLGYREGFQKMPHELGNFSRDIEVDVHKFFPVWRYPDDIDVEDLDPLRRPGRWEVRSWMANTKLDYELLVRHSLMGGIPGTNDIRFCDAAAATLVRCLHIFKRYVEVPPFAPIAKVRLAELAEVLDLAGYKSFDRQAFARLVHASGAADAVAFVARLLNEYFGVQPLPVPFVATRRVWPRDLYWGLLTVLPGALDDLLIDSTSSAAVVDHLGFTSLRAGVPGDGGGRRPFDTAERVIVRGVGLDSLPLGLAALWGDAALELSVAVRSPVGPILDEVVFMFGGASLYCGYRTRQGEFVVAGGLGSASIALNDGGYQVTATFPWERLRPYVEPGASVPVTVVACRFLEEGIDDWGERFARTVMTTAAPFRIVRP